MSKFIFVIGSSGTGKSTVSKEIEGIANELGASVAILELDHYYLPKHKMDPSKPKNFDIPEALEQQLVIEHLQALEAGNIINRPTYAMAPSDRVEGGEMPFVPQDIIIVEGIFAGDYVKYLNRETQRLKIYLQSPHVNDNYTRKESRDEVERQKSKEHIQAMKKNQIACLFKYVAPHMNSSDIIIDNSWQPSDDNLIEPMIQDDYLDLLKQFMRAKDCSLKMS